MYLTDDMPSIVDVLQHYGADMNRTSGQVNIRCPFHDDTHKSASFNTRENIFNCFACGMQGNSLQVIAKKEGVDIREAKSFAEGITGQGSGKVRSKHLSGGRLPQKQRHPNGDSTAGAIRRSRRG